jgi:hypothetical protein
MQHGNEYSVGAFVTFETKLQVMESNILYSAYMYNFYTMTKSDATSTETTTCPIQDNFCLWLRQ